MPRRADRREYVNRVLIPLLYAKAGVLREDVHGAITGHRARATIASPLYNAKEPISLFELQAWLGHISPSSTQHTVDHSDRAHDGVHTLATFARNVAIEVLLDRDAIQTGAASAGNPLRPGHGYCRYSFFEHCPHRMACARCDFYIPKPSNEAQLLEAKDGSQRMLVEIPLTDDDRAAVQGGPGGGRPADQSARRRRHPSRADAAGVDERHRRAHPGRRRAQSRPGCASR